jgi:hypothetical protein
MKAYGEMDVQIHISLTSALAGGVYYIRKIQYTFNNFHARAIAQAISRWLPTLTARVRARVWSNGVCGGQTGAGAGFLRVHRFPLPIFITQNSPSSQSHGVGTIGQLVAEVPSGPSLDSPPPTMLIKKNNFLPAST